MQDWSEYTNKAEFNYHCRLVINWAIVNRIGFGIFHILEFECLGSPILSTEANMYNANILLLIDFGYILCVFTLHLTFAAHKILPHTKSLPNCSRCIKFSIPIPTLRAFSVIELT